MGLSRYLVDIHKRLMLGEGIAPPAIPAFPPSYVEEVSGRLGMVLIPDRRSESNVCLADSEEVRPEYRSSFSSVDLLNYVYALLHVPKHKGLASQGNIAMPVPEDATEFWRLAEIGGQLRQLHLLESPLLEDTSHPFPAGGDNAVTKPRFVPEEPAGKSGETGFHSPTGRIYINDSQYFDQVPVGVWDVGLAGYLPARKWLEDRKGRKLALEDIRHYQKIIAVLAGTERLVRKMDTPSIR